MTAMSTAYGQVLERLQGLSRSAEQDMVIRRLLDAGMDIQTLDCAQVKRAYAGESFRPRVTYLIFRDRRDMRWVVDRQGNMTVSGRTSWQVIP